MSFSELAFPSALQNYAAESISDMFAEQKVSEFCNSIKDIHQILSSIGRSFIELAREESPGGKGARSGPFP